MTTSELDQAPMECSSVASPRQGDLLGPTAYWVRLRRPGRRAVRFTRCGSLREAARVAARLRRAGFDAHIAERAS